MPTILTDTPMYKKYLHLEIHNLYSCCTSQRKAKLSISGYLYSYIW